jgi:hypothetical protein
MLERVERHAESGRPGASLLDGLLAGHMTCSRGSDVEATRVAVLRGAGDYQIRTCAQGYRSLPRQAEDIFMMQERRIDDGRARQLLARTRRRRSDVGAWRPLHMEGTRRANRRGVFPV